MATPSSLPSSNFGTHQYSSIIPPLSSVALGEARRVLSVLRRNKRYSNYFTAAFRSSSISDNSHHHPLVHEIKALRSIIQSTYNDSNSPHTILQLLEPFLQIIKSKDTSGLITGTTLQALIRITTHLINNISTISSLSKNYLINQYAPIFSEIITSTASCRFDPTDPIMDDTVLLHILNLLSKCVVSPIGFILPDAVVLRAFDACAAIASGRRRRSSDLLTKNAEQSLVEIIRATASRVNMLSMPERDVLMQVLADNSVGRVASPMDIGMKGIANNGDVNWNRENVESNGRGPFDFMELDKLSERGPPTLLSLRVMIRMACHMADPAITTSVEEQSLGHSLLNAALDAGGQALCKSFSTSGTVGKEEGGNMDILKQILLLEVSPAVIRSVSTFSSPPSMIAASFVTAMALVHVLAQSATPLIFILLRKIFPLYISGIKNRFPHQCSGLNPNLVDKADIIDPTVRELGLEALCEMIATPGLLASIYAVGDCELRVPDIVQPLISWLSSAALVNRRRATEPYAVDDDDELAKEQAANVANLCSEALLSIVNAIENQLGYGSTSLQNGSVHGHDEERDLKNVRLRTKRRRRVRARKLVYNNAVEALAAKSKIGNAERAIKFLKDRQICCSLEVDTNDPEKKTSDNTESGLESDIRHLVTFFRECPDVDKTKIGEVLGEPDATSRKVLDAYVKSFDFAGRTFSESLRVFMESFRIPGEAQKIERILESFANHYYEQNKAESRGRDSVSNSSIDDRNVSVDTSAGDSQQYAPPGSSKPVPGSPRSIAGVFANAEAAFVMSYSVVMLNTDQHSTSVKKKMTLGDFVRNNREVNDGKDFPRWFLSDIFHSIRQYEIRTSDTSNMAQLTSLEWKRFIQLAGTELPASSQAIFHNEDVFRLLWRSCVPAASLLLAEAADANEAQNALEGFLSIARIASVYRLTEPCDAVISALTTATGLLEGPLHGVAPRFGKSIKSQMASVTLLGVSREYGDWIRSKGWRSLVSYILRLHALGLLPKELEKEYGSYGSDFVTPEGKPFTPSSLVPAWWPSHNCQGDGSSVAKRNGTSRKANGFLAAFLGVSLGDESESDEEHQNNEQPSSISMKVSSSPPSYLEIHDPEDAEAQELARKCIGQCKIQELLMSQVKVLRSESLKCLVQGFARAAHKILDGRDGTFSHFVKGSRAASAERAVSSASSGSTEPSPDLAGKGIRDVEQRGQSGRKQLVANGKKTVLDSSLEPQSPKHDSSAVIGTSVIQSVSANALESGVASEASPRVAKDERKARTLVVAFCVNALTSLSLLNEDRVLHVWSQLLTLLVRILSAKATSVSLLEVAVFSLLRVSSRLLHREEVRHDVLRSLHLLLRLPEKVWTALCVPIVCGTYRSLEKHGHWIRSTSGWHSIFGIIESAAKHPSAAPSVGLQSLDLVFGSIGYGNDAKRHEDQDDPITSKETFGPLLDAICAYTVSSSLETSIAALDLLHKLSKHLMNKGPLPWEGYWGPLMRGLGAGAQDPRGKVRNHALKVLERVTATGGNKEFLTAAEWRTAFDTIYLTLMRRVFATNGMLDATADAERAAQRAMRQSAGRRARDAFFMKAEHDAALMRGVRAACGRTRLFAVALISKTFLQHHGIMAKGLDPKEFERIWSDVLGVYQEAWKSATNEAGELQEHVPENAKNLILVLASNGVLKRGDESLWRCTVAGVQDFLPNLEELIMAATEPQAMVKAPEREMQKSESCSRRDAYKGSQYLSKESQADAKENIETRADSREETISGNCIKESDEKTEAEVANKPVISVEPIT